MSDGSNITEPLCLSFIAGISTCIGAAVVFCQPKVTDNSTTSSVSGEGEDHISTTKIRSVVSPDMMAFSLALAGSVMITVSVVSILPEILADPHSDPESGYKLIPIQSWDMLFRLLFMILGSVVYFCMSWFFVIPEPEDLLIENIESIIGDNKKRNNTANTIKDDFNNDEEEHTMMLELTSSHASFDDVECKSPIIRRRDSPTSREIKPLISFHDDDQSSNANYHIRKNSLSNNNRTKPKKKGEAFSQFSAWASGKDLRSKDEQKAWRVAMLLFFSLLVHNFPEGLAVAASALESQKLGITVTIGIMIHNIPEGIAIAIPCLAARPDRPCLSFVLASVSGLAEPLGALVALIFLRNMESTVVTEEGVTIQQHHLVMSLDNILAFVAGTMVMVSVRELLPEAKRHATKTQKYFWYGIIVGVVVMVLTELFLP